MPDETDYEFVPNAKADDGTPSLKSAGEVGSYMACFKLKDPAMCEWEGESEDASEVWVPWSIKFSPFDPNSKEVTYWGTASDTTTTVSYTGEPIWVRPWWTPAKSIGGEFPEWFTHWGSEGRPTTDRQSSVVVYTQGDDDYEGLVGYHTNADGTLEKVTAEQVYAWANGVDVGGKHVAAESGDKVWYKTGEDGWKVPLAVQGEAPEGAEGYVVARNYAYADRLGVMESGEYQAYAYFDDGAGFAATSLAESTVVVKPADAPKTADTTKTADAPKTADTPKTAAATPKTGSDSKPSASSSTPKTGDFSPYAVGDIALVGLIAAGGAALSLARRRC